MSNIGSGTDAASSYETWKKGAHTGTNARRAEITNVEKQKGINDAKMPLTQVLNYSNPYQKEKNKIS